MSLEYFAQNSIQISMKRKVYFSFHPDDFNSYSKAISNDLFLHSDCVVYYYGNNEETTESVKNFDLSHMQMFVFAVTKKFLTEPSAAAEFDLKYALDKHIPVLPIILETGIEELALEKFGSVQFIDKTALSTDSYNNRLENFMKTIGGEEKIEKRLEEVFHGKAFISYRKKDRIDAISVMKTLHYRSINSFLGMWYDEFLIPGEDFNENIAEGIENCDIFVMVITPNIIEKGNYVLNNEYPLAKKLNKFIIPVVTHRFDGNALKQKYPDLPPVVSIQDHKRLSELVKEGLSHIPEKKKELDDFYYMGLAFMDGIGVEKNPKMGLELIEFAAKKNRISAIMKLVSMYRWGEGVEQDFAIALKWQKKLVEKRKRVLEKKNIADNRKAYYNSVYTLSYLYQKNEMYKEAVEAAREGISYAEKTLSQQKFKDSYKDIKLRFELLTHLMGVLHSAGKTDEAIKVYESFIGDLEEKERNDAKYNSQLVATYNSMQRIYEESGNLKGVHMMADKNLEVISRSKKGEYGRTNIPHAMAHSRKGNAYFEEKNYAAAEKEYKAAIEIYEGFKKLDDERDVHNICIMTSDLGYLYKQTGKYDESIELYLKAIEYRKLIMEKPEHRRSMYIYLANLSQVYYLSGRYEEAEKYFAETDKYFTLLCKLFPDEFKIENFGCYRPQESNTAKKPASAEQTEKKPKGIADIIFAIIGLLCIIVYGICKGVYLLIKKFISMIK